MNDYNFSKQQKRHLFGLGVLAAVGYCIIALLIGNSDTIGPFASAWLLGLLGLTIGLVLRRSAALSWSWYHIACSGDSASTPKPNQFPAKTVKRGLILRVVILTLGLNLISTVVISFPKSEIGVGAMFLLMAGLSIATAVWVGARFGLSIANADYRDEHEQAAI